MDRPDGIVAFLPRFLPVQQDFAVVVTADPDQLQAHGLSADQVVEAIAKNNTITPSGNLPVGTEFPIVAVNSMVKQVKAIAEAMDRRIAPIKKSVVAGW